MWRSGILDKAADRFRRHAAGSDGRPREPRQLRDFARRQEGAGLRLTAQALRGKWGTAAPDRRAAARQGHRHRLVAGRLQLRLHRGPQTRLALAMLFRVVTVICLLTALTFIASFSPTGLAKAQEPSPTPSVGPPPVPPICDRTPSFVRP